MPSEYFLGSLECDIRSLNQDYPLDHFQAKDVKITASFKFQDTPYLVDFKLDSWENLEIDWRTLRVQDKN